MNDPNAGGMRTPPPGTKAVIGGDFAPTPPPVAMQPEQAAVPPPLAPEVVDTPPEHTSAEEVRPVEIKAGRASMTLWIYQFMPFAFLADLLVAQGKAQKARSSGRQQDASQQVMAMAEMVVAAVANADEFEAFLKDRRNRIGAREYTDIIMTVAREVAAGQGEDTQGKA